MDTKEIPVKKPEILSPNGVIEVKTNTFTNAVKGFLGECTIRLNFKADELIGAKINTDSKINMTQNRMLVHTMNYWNFQDMEISRSGAGLKIEFKK